MNNRLLKTFFVLIFISVALWKGLEFSWVQEACIRFFVNSFSPYQVSSLEMRDSKKFPFQVGIKNISLSKDRAIVFTAENIAWEFSGLPANGIVLCISKCDVIPVASSLNTNYGLFSPFLIGSSLQNISKKLQSFFSIRVDQLRIQHKEISLQLSCQKNSWITKIVHKGEPLTLFMTKDNKHTFLRLDGFWEGNKVFGDVKLDDYQVEINLKANIRSFVNALVADFLGDYLTLSLRLEKFTDWQIKPLKIETSKGHYFQGDCLQKKDLLDGSFTWKMPLKGINENATCFISVEGSARCPVIKWNFKELRLLEDLSGECIFVNDNHIKLAACLQHDEKNRAAAKMDISLNSFLMNGKIFVHSVDLQKLLGLFCPDLKGSLSLNAQFEDVRSIERGHVVIDGEGVISDIRFYAPITIKTTLHNGLGNGNFYLTKGQYRDLPINISMAFNSTTQQINIEKCQLQIQDAKFILEKSAFYDWSRGLKKARIQFCEGVIDIEQLKIGTTLAKLDALVGFKNIHLHKLKTFFKGYDFSGVLDGYIQKKEDNLLKAKFSLSKGFLRQSQNGHVYEVLNSLNATLATQYGETIWSWDAKIKDKDKINIETKGTLDVKTSKVDTFLKGLIRLKLLTDWLATDDRIFGDISVDLRALGQLNSPILEGTIAADNGLYEHSEVGTFYQNITIRMKGQGKKLLVTHFSGQDITSSNDSKQGQFRGEGWIDFSDPLLPTFHIPLHLYHLRIAQNDGFRSDASGVLIIAGKGADVGCKGEVTLEDAHYYIETSVESKVPQIIDKRENIERKKKVKEYLTVFPLDILIHTPKNSFKVTGMGVDSIWGGDFYVRRSIANPFLEGTVYLEKGALDILGKVLHMTHGEITFVDTDRNNPRLNIEAVKKLDDTVTIAIEIKGTGSNTIIDFSSVPSMPREEVLSLLLFGKKLGEVSVLQSVQLAELANAESNDGQGFFKKIRSNFGFDQFEFKTSTRGGASATDEDATPQERAEARTSQAVRIGKEFGKVQVAIEQGAGSETSKLTVSTPLGKNLILQGDVGGAQNSGVGISWVKRYQ